MTAPEGTMKLVPTVWVQRAVNAWFTRMRLDIRVVVDGIAGPQTLRALENMRQYLVDTHAGTALHSQIVDHDHLALDPWLYGMLSNTTRVADPAGSTVGLCSWSAVAQMVSQGPSTAVVDPSQSTMVPASSWATQWSVESVVVPAVAFLASAALGVALVRYGAPKRGRR